MIRVRFKNNKNGKIYILCGCVTNRTNSNDGQKMCMYFQEDDKHVPLDMNVREYSEFFEKFTQVVE